MRCLKRIKSSGRTFTRLPRSTIISQDYIIQTCVVVVEDTLQKQEIKALKKCQTCVLVLNELHAIHQTCVVVVEDKLQKQEIKALKKCQTCVDVLNELHAIHQTDIIFGASKWKLSS